MIRILVDSSSDYSLEEIKEKKLCLIPITVTMNGTDYMEGLNMERDDFYHMLENSPEFPQTSQPSPQSFLDIFEEVKAKGDTLICILLSSQLSGTCQSAHLAKSMVDYNNIYIIDSLSATYTIKVMADYACQLVKAGHSAEEIVTKVEALKSRVKVVAALDTLEYLYKGGRLSKASAAIGTVANIKPIITLTENGTIGVLGKALGKCKAVAAIISRLQEVEIDTCFPVYSIYSYGMENCEKLEGKLADNGFTIDKRLQIGSTIGTHIGSGAYGVVFVTK